MKKFIAFFSLAVLLITAFCLPVSAASYETRTKGPGGSEVTTQTAYEPEGIFNIGLNGASDLYYDKTNQNIYIADTGNARILAVSADGSFVSEIGKGTLKTPTGVAVHESKVYVADKDAGAIFIFDSNGSLINTLTRPIEAIFGKSAKYIPLKVAVNARGSVFCTSEGSTEGVVQISANGEFSGYVGANITPVSLSSILKKIFFTEEQREKLLKAAPPSPTSIALSSQDLLITVTNGTADTPVKKLNSTGNLITAPDASEFTVDAACDADENIFTVGSDGVISVFDSLGSLLFSFGGMDISFERIGFLRNPAALDVTEAGKILVLDKDLNAVFVYTPTNFASNVFSASRLYSEGFYVKGKPQWENILKQNSSFILSYRALAAADLKEENFTSALNRYRFAEDRTGYSNALWEIRNIWIQNYMGLAVLIIAFFFLTVFVLKRLHRKTGMLSFASNGVKRIGNQKTVRELTFSLYFLRHPIDGYYEIKKGRASVMSATLLYGVYLLISVLGIHLTGFVFAANDPQKINIAFHLLQSLLPFMVWIGANYLVSTISDGEGSLKNLYISTIYAFTPYLYGILPMLLLSNVLTRNEEFVYTYGMAFLYVLCGINMFLQVKEIHNYTFWESVKNIWMTIIAITLFSIMAVIIYLLVNQEWDYVASVIQEAVVTHGK